MKKLLIVTTGGTIDKIYFDDMSDYQIGDPQIGHILHDLQVGFDFDVNPLMRKDSLHVTDEDRQTIHDAIASSDAKHVLVTHGTDSMVKTALLLADIPGKTIVLTGALTHLGQDGLKHLSNVSRNMTTNQEFEARRDGAVGRSVAYSSQTGPKTP